MKTFEFALHGGITVEVDKEALTISVKGVKGFFKKIKPRTKTISFDQIVRVDYKTAGITVGYVRIITPELVPYPSSMYVAEHDPNAFIFEKENMPQFNALMEHLQKVLPNVSMKSYKM